MAWQDLVEQGFPSPHDAEPRNLRRDIADELADHLTCALQHEIHRTENEAEARRNVVARFGDPARVARQLWFAAMKESIMKDRLLLGLVAVLALATIVTTVFAWSALAESRRTNQALLAGLQKLGSTPSELPDSMWTTATFRLVREDNGEPVVGQGVGLRGNAFTEKSALLFEQTDEDGRVKFGPIRAGQYTLTIRRQWFEIHSRAVDLYPGRPLDQQIACPSIPATASVSFELDWGGEVPLQNLIAEVQLHPVTPHVGEDQWYAESPRFTLSATGKILTDERGQGRNGPKPVRPEWGGSPQATITWAGTTPQTELPAIVFTPEVQALFAIISEGQRPVLLRVVAEHEDFGQFQQVFKPTPGESNHVVIPVPAELRAQVEEKLAELAEQDEE
jgi:hypothetical protein